jgi:hypothetical protein
MFVTPAQAGIQASTVNHVPCLPSATPYRVEQRRVFHQNAVGSEGNRGPGATGPPPFAGLLPGERL